MSTFGGGNEPQDVKLSEAEQKLVAKLFSDPTYFPVEFRTWLKNYIQDAGITVTTSQVRGGGTGVRTNLPPGLIITCGSVKAIPPDAINCDGTAYSRAIYSALYDMIGIQWGPGDGSTTFNVPDSRDRAFFGAGSTVAVGATDGWAFGSRTGPFHSTTIHDTGHSHPQPDGVVAFNRNPSTGGAGASGGDRSLEELFGTSHNGTGIWAGTPGQIPDQVHWAGVVFAITTGKPA